jgi:hypothetical protein
VAEGRTLKAETDQATLNRMRRYLLALFIVGVIGTIVELLLAQHTEDVLQYIPFILLALSLAALLLHAVMRRRPTLRTFQILMVLFVAAGVTGSALHYRGKTEFALERQPDLEGFALFRETLKGKNPPMLAPGAMIVLGLIGLIWTYRLPTEPTGADA